MKKLAKSSLLSLSLFLASASGVGAQTAAQNQQLDQTIKVNCTTGAYGQSSSCSAEGTQSGSQSQYLSLDNTRRRVCRQDGSCMYVHDPINAGVDPLTLLASGLTSVGLLTAGVVTLRKSR